MAIRALMVNRAEAKDAPGGDAVQMRQTAHQLRKLDLEVEESYGAPTEAQLRMADVVHLFNLHTAEFTKSQLDRARVAAKPVAFSSIFWNYDANEVLARSKKWRALAAVMGRKEAIRFLKGRLKTIQAPLNALRKEILLGVDICLPNSHGEQQILNEVAGKALRHQVVCNGIDVDLFDLAARYSPPEFIEENRLRSREFVLCVGRVELPKNQLSLLRALHRMEIPVVLVGDVTEPSYADSCRRNGAILAGSSTGTELAAAYAHCRAHVLPSLKETVGLASLEAAAMGCSVATTSVGGIREYLGDDAHYLDPLELNSIRTAALAAWNNPAHAQLARHVRMNFTWARAAEQTKLGYEIIL